jgi:hypothetical protein
VRGSIGSLCTRLAVKINEATQSLADAETNASNAMTAREAAQAEVNEIEAMLRPIERRADAQRQVLAPFLTAERGAAHRNLTAAKADQANSEKALEVARKALADLRLAEEQLFATGRSSGHGGCPSEPSESRKARSSSYKQGSRAAILSGGLAHA